MRRFIQITLLLLLLIGGGGGWYLYRKGLTKPWRELVTEELRKRGVEVAFGTLAIEPFRGLVARDVRIYDSPARKRTVARVNEMVVEANYAAAARGQPFLDALTLVDAALDLPLDSRDPSGPVLQIAKLNTRIVLPQDRIVVSRLNAVVFGIHVNAAGQLAHPEALTTKDDAPEKKSDLSLVARIFDELRLLKYSGRPRLDIRFDGDALAPSSLAVDATLHTGRIERRGYVLDDLDIALAWQNEAIVVQRFDARDAVGRLQVAGTFSPASRELDVRLRSGMDVPGLLRAAGIWEPGEVHFESTPQLDCELIAKFEKPGVPRAKRDGDGRMDLSGRVRLGKFSYGKVPFDRLAADFAWDGKRWAVRDFLLRHRTAGEISGGVQQDYDSQGKGDFRAALLSTLNPAALAPFFAGNEPWQQTAAARLALFKFPDAPRIELSANGEAPLQEKIAITAQIRAGRLSYRDRDAKSLNATLRFANNVLNVDKLDIQRAEGPADAELVFDFNQNLVFIKNARLNVVPTDIALWIDPDLVKDITPYRFPRKQPFLFIDGVVDRVKPGRRTRVAVRIDSPTGMDYTFLGKNLSFDKVETRLLFADDRMKMTDTRAVLFGGVVKGSADISIIRAKPGHVAELKFVDVDFPKLTKLYFDYDDSKGKLDANYSFQGRGDQALTMRGEGSLKITDGNVFAIPFLGPFSDILSKIIPGFGFDAARKAECTFAIADGVITTKDFEIDGRGFKMLGDGRVWFLEDRMDFDMRLTPQGPLGFLLYPLSKVLEYRAQSKFSKPDWRMKAIPKVDSILPRIPLPKPALPARVRGAR